ncbi:hypothetical protein EZS27_030110 [termite gut metagenome]|uniref:HTH arsR-type domain-containing protein n=1 Tax=termite gut metagenome TaxID=433724 RepID=A0A5J4QGN0_9ZZZZ
MYKNDIGINAGVIWHLLSHKGALSIREIGELTNYRESFMFLALGYLSRESKIRFFEKKRNVVYRIEPSSHGNLLLKNENIQVFTGYRTVV